MLNRLSEAITDAGIPLERVEGTVVDPELVFQPVATQQQRDDAAVIVDGFDWSEEAHRVWLESKNRQAASTKIDQPDVEAKVLRALVHTLVDEINLLRRWVVDFKTHVTEATNLGDLKTRVATLPDMPDRTLQQAKATIIAKIDSGESDT